MSITFKIATTDCGDIEITSNANIKSSVFISGYITDMGLTEDYIDLTAIGHHNLTAIQARRFYAIWNFLSGTEEGSEYMERANIQYWLYRNYRLDDCLDAPLREVLKTVSNHEVDVVKQDLVNNTIIQYGELYSNEYTKEFLEKGYIGIGLTSDLVKYANFLGIDSVNRMLCGVLCGHLKRLVKVFPTEPVSIPAATELATIEEAIDEVVC
jgi:hypothetical protein